MIPAEFDYLRPHSVEEAVAELGRAGEDAKVLAGGQSLLPLLRLRLAYPTVLVDLGGVGELRGIREDGDELVIGAMTTHHDGAARPAGRRSTARCWPRPPRTVADPAVRHRGTFGGALAHADPAGDLPAVALALDATFVIAGRRTARRTVAGAGLLRRLPGDRGRSRASCWSRCGCRCSAPAGAARTRSSTGSPRPGRSSAWRRWSAGTTAPSPRPGSG